MTYFLCFMKYNLGLTPYAKSVLYMMNSLIKYKLKCLQMQL